MAKLVRLVRFLFVCSVLLAIAGGVFVGLTIWYFGRDLPDYQTLARYEPPITTHVHAGDGRLLAEYATERRVFVPVSAIPKLVVDAFLSAEDKNFYSHHGIDPLSIVRAAILDLGRWHDRRRPIGASTITQQVAKNMLLTNQLSVARKVKEILLAIRIDESLSKDHILELYLNEIYLGAGSYGVAAAALTYFDKPLDELTLGEAAFLAGLPKAPSNYNPVRYPQAAENRRNWVLDRMVEDGYATAAEAAAAKAEPVVVRHREAAEVVKAAYFAEEVRRELLARYGERALYESGLSVRTSLDPPTQAAANTALRDGLIAYDHSHGGWRGPVAHIDATGDWPLHLAAVAQPPGADAMAWQLAVVLRTEGDGARIGLKNGTVGLIPFAQLRWARRRLADGALGAYPRSARDVVKPGDVVLVAPAPESATAATASRVSVVGHSAGGRLLARTRAAPLPLFELCQIPGVSGALVAIDPHTGRVLAISGGFSFEISQFDRATQAERQPGSAIKPFVYLTALQHGFTPSTLVLDAPISLPQGPGLPPWTPSDYEHAFMGPVPLRVALEHSLNTATARVAQIIGMEAIGETVESFGIMDHMPREYSMSLGAGETTPLRLTAAYAMLVNGGKRIAPTLVDRVQDRNGLTVFRADRRPCPGCSNVEWTHQKVPVIPDTRPQIADPQSAFQIVQMMEGVVQRGTGVAVKAVDKPIAGKTGTTSDWRDAWFVGFTPDLAAGVYIGYDDHASLGKGEQAAVVAAPVFRDFMIAALKNSPPTEFRIPPGLQMYRVNPQTGLPPGPGEPGIWEAYKPGTAPGKDRDMAMHGMPGDQETSQMSAPDANAAPASAAPATGTGGLY